MVLRFVCKAAGGNIFGPNLAGFSRLDRYLVHIGVLTFGQKATGYIVTGYPGVT